MIQCTWCPKQFEDEELTILHIHMPNYTGPRMEINNGLCPDCIKATLESVAAVELSIKQKHGAEINGPSRN